MAKRFLLLGLVATVILAGCAGMTSKKELGKIWVKVGQANIRSAATVESKIVVTLQRGDKLKVLEESRRWYKVRLPDERIGWIHKSLITPTKP